MLPTRERVVTAETMPAQPVAHRVHTRMNPDGSGESRPRDPTFTNDPERPIRSEGRRRTAQSQSTDSPTAKATLFTGVCRPWSATRPSA